MSMIINPHRFGVAGAPSDWQTVHDSAFTNFSSNWSNYTIRTFISRSLLPAGATKVRVTLGSSSSTGLKVSKAYIGKSRHFIFDEAPSQLLFGGNAGFTIAAANGVQISDELDFNYDGTSDLCISFYVPSDASPNNTMGTLGGNSFMGSEYVGGDSANTTGGTWARTTTTIYGIRKVEVFTGGSWKNIFLSHTAYPTNWLGYTIRGLYAVGHFTRSRPVVRVGMASRVTDLFIGNSAEGSNPFDFLSTPTRLTFGGANGTGTEEFRAYFTDEFNFESVVDPTKPLLLSYHTASSRIGERASPPTGQSTRYKSGNSASVVSWQSGSSTWGSFLGPQFIDEKY